MDLEVDELLLLQETYFNGLDDGPAPPEEQTGPIIIPRKNTCLHNDARKTLLLDLFAASDDGLSLPRGAIKDACTKYKVSRTTVWRLFKDALQQKLNGESVIIKNNRFLCGRTPLVSNVQTLMEVPLKQRTTMRSFTKALKVSPSTVHRLVKTGMLRTHSNSIKPKLTNKHRMDRVQFVLRFVIPPIVFMKPRFNLLFNLVHIDEKLFFMTKTIQRYYLGPEEEDPYRTCQSKGFITKVMFLAALARPRIDDGGELLWDEKIGIFLFTEEVAAQRNSIHRPRGTMEIKPIQNVNKDTIKGFF